MRFNEDAVGILSGMLGNASEIDAEKIPDEFSQLLVPDEKVEHAYLLIRDYFVFTDKRLVIVDKQGVTGKKVEYHSIPYKNITHFSTRQVVGWSMQARMNRELTLDALLMAVWRLQPKQTVTVQLTQYQPVSEFAVIRRTDC